MEDSDLIFPIFGPSLSTLSPADPHPKERKRIPWRQGIIFDVVHHV